jgi:hypothetical protein
MAIAAGVLSGCRWATSFGGNGCCCGGRADCGPFLVAYLKIKRNVHEVVSSHNGKLV